MNRSLYTKRRVLFGLIGIYATSQVISYIKSSIIAYKLKKKAQNKLLLRNSLKITLPIVPEEKQKLILSLTASKLAKAIHERKITSTEAVATYILRSITIGREMNLITEECYIEALEQAKICDQMSEENRSFGVFHGVPISIKDQISIKGCTSTAGVAWKLDYPDTETALLVKILQAQGAIPFVKSNVPQMLMWFECCNNIYGRGLNPWNRLRTTGGSSGGECGLIACRASPLGIGSDIGGSIRTPCSFCGVYGLKPTPQRMTTKGMKNSMPFNIQPLDQQIFTCCGPIGKCVKDLVLVMQTIWSDQLFKLDKTLPPLKFDISAYQNQEKRLKIGYILDLPYFDSADCIKNSIKKCLSELGKKHEIVEFEIPHAKEIIDLYLRACNANGNKFIEMSLQGETPNKSYNFQLFSNRFPMIKKVLLQILRLFAHKRVADFIEVPRTFSPAEYIENSQRMQDLSENLTKYWENNEIDVVICPAFGVAAPQHEKGIDVLGAFVYSAIWNVVGYPAGVVPVDTATIWAKKVMENSSGIPYALQIVGLPYKDELVLGVMRQIEKIFQFHRYPL